MRSAEDALLSELDARGISPGHLFIIGDKVFVSEDAGDFRAASRYRALSLGSSSRDRELLDLAKKLSAPHYYSEAQVQDIIGQYREWEALYDSLLVVLQRHGTHDPFGKGDFYLIDDYYSSPQHKIECISKSKFTPLLVEAIQAELRNFDRAWEVIVVLHSEPNDVIAYTVTGQTCRESNA